MLVTEDNYWQMVDHVIRVGRFSLDTETTGLEWTDKPFAATIATEEKVFYMEHMHFLRPIIHCDMPLEVVMINAKFDMRMLRVPFNNNWKVRDISIFERILSNDSVSLAEYSLNAIARKRLGRNKSKEVEEEIKNNKHFIERFTKYTNEKYRVPCYDLVDREILQTYAELDAILTLECYQKQLEEADEDDLRVFDMECDLLQATYKMEMDGIKLDEVYTEKALQDEARQLEHTKENFRTLVGQYYENKKSLLIPVFEQSGEAITYTEKGNPRLTDEDLESFTSPAAKLVQKIRHHEKRISTYFTTYLDLVDDSGFIHPNIIQHGTKTGRFSYANPNLQNIPKDEDIASQYTVRGCLIPTSGNLFLSLDYSQQEYRMMLDYANEKRVIEEVMRGTDLHQAVADKVGITRKHAKTLSFGILYGSGPAKVAKMLGIPVSEARILRDNYLLALPKVDKFISDVIGVSRSRGFVKNWLGRKLRNEYEYAYKSPNHLIQGGCGDVVKLAMIGLHRTLFHTCIKMRLQVHDQIVFEGPEEELVHYYATIRDIMQSIYPTKNGMILKVDASYSPTSLEERKMRKWIIGQDGKSLQKENA